MVDGRSEAHGGSATRPSAVGRVAWRTKDLGGEVMADVMAQIETIASVNFFGDPPVPVATLVDPPPPPLAPFDNWALMDLDAFAQSNTHIDSRVEFMEPWLLDEDSNESGDHVRLLKSSMFPYAPDARRDLKRARMQSFSPENKPISKAPMYSMISSGNGRKKPAMNTAIVNHKASDAFTASLVLKGGGRMAGVGAVKLATKHLVMYEMVACDWSHFCGLHRTLTTTAMPTEESRLLDIFKGYLEQWRANRLGPLIIFAHDTLCPEGHFAGFLLMSLSKKHDDHPILQLRFSLIAQYCHQQRVVYEALHAAFKWLIEYREVFDASWPPSPSSASASASTDDDDEDDDDLDVRYRRGTPAKLLYIPFEISASRQNCVSMSLSASDLPVLLAATLDTLDGAQQQMMLVCKKDLLYLTERLEKQLISNEMMPDVINADIWTTQSANGIFEMVVKWEISLIKIDEDGSIHLFMSTYHDTAVDVTFLMDLEADQRMCLDLCIMDDKLIAIDESPESCRRIKTKVLQKGQTSISFSGVRKPKVGDKSKVYVIRAQLVRLGGGDGDPVAVVVDTCISRLCQLTASRRVYRVVDERADDATPEMAAKVVASDWESHSPLLTQFVAAVQISWKPGFAMWLYTQDKIVMEVTGNLFPPGTAMKVQLVDVQSNIPVHLCLTHHGVKTSAAAITTTSDESGARWVVDLRVNSKKDVHNRKTYLHVTFHRVRQDCSLVADALAEFTSAFVISVSTTYANLKRRHV